MLADHGIDVLRGHAALQLGVNTHRGQLTYQGVAEAFGLPYVQTAEALSQWSAQAQ